MSHRKTLFVSLLNWLAIFYAFSVASAQSTTATLSGTVIDESGGVLPKASVTIINTKTNAQRRLVTDGDGTFIAPLLPPSSYTVCIERDGFARAEIRQLTLNVNDQRSLQIQLKIGEVGETVNITAEAALSNESAAVGTVIDRQFVENLPLNGRTFQALIALTPGTVITPTSFSEQGQFSVNGQRPDANYFTVDGVSANAGVSGGNSLMQSAGGTLPSTNVLGGTSNLASIDALQEFRVQTSTYAPEFGRSPGAQVQIITRSGTNEFHGSLFDYFRNDLFDANDWFANRNGLEKPAIRQNNFGAVIGGPILSPKRAFGPLGYDGRNRSFFFFSYEGLRLRQPQVGITTVPSLETRRNAHPRLRPFLDVFPKPNGKDLAGGLAELNASFSDPASSDATSIRLDQTVGAKLALFGRYNRAPSQFTARGVGTSLNTMFPAQAKTDTLTLGATWAISATTHNDLRFNYSRNEAGTDAVLDDFGGGATPSDSLFFPSPFSRKDSLAQIVVLPTATYVLGKNVRNVQRQINVVDNLSVVQGAHSLKFGVDYRRLAPTSGPSNYRVVAYFDADTLPAGNASLSNVDAGQNVDLFLTNFSAYGRDTWKVSPRLTLTYGLRWEVNPPPSGKKGLEPFAVTGFDNLDNLALAPRGTPLWKATYNNFAPRIGAAYHLSRSPRRETVIRGGFGVFYDLGSASVGRLTGAGTFPFGGRKLFTGTPFPLSPEQAAPPPISAEPPVTSNFQAFDPNLKLPRTYQWSLAVEQSLGANRSLTASYVAAVGRRLTREESLRNVNQTFFSTVELTSNGATSDYHGLQMQFQQRLSRGLQALASYTWSKSLDISSSSLGGTANVRGIDPRVDRGPSDFDVRHSFNTALTYNLPTPPIGSFGKALLGNWSIDTIITARSASPLDVVVRDSVTDVDRQIFGSFRPDLIPGAPFYIEDPNVGGGRRINREAFAEPSDSTIRQGALGRNALRGFPAQQIDLALRREFKLREALKLQFRGEFFNLFNHPNFANPSGNLEDPLFGESTQMLGRGMTEGGGLTPLHQVGGSRSMQFALKLLF
jgi:Carboxypeptidase regulatory-like domain/TonB dependent receptor